MTFAEDIGAMETGYYHYSLLALAEIAEERGDKKLAKEYLKKVKKYADRKDRVHKEARSSLREL